MEVSYINQTDLYGRQQTFTPAMLATANNIPHLKRRPAMMIKGRWVYCNRCRARHLKQQVQLADGRYYCPACLLLGRICSDDYLMSLPEPNAFSHCEQPLTWKGQLTHDQQAAAQQIKANFCKRQDHLLWAVTGAGKTEMLFPGLTWALAQGLRIGVASPRVDVCLELFPRFQAAFSQHTIMLLHGRQAEPYYYSQFVLCTTHQLLRFYHAFDILVIDEVDAFPYAQDPQLAFATQQALKTDGARLFLTATPSKQLLYQVRLGKLTLSYLPKRYHGYPLPQPKVRLCFSWQKQLLHNRLPPLLKQLLAVKLKQQQHFLLFVPRIALLPTIAKLLHQTFPELKFATVHASDPARLEKVEQMRQQRLDCLVTTTILERGVTFAGIDVIVLGSEDPVFSVAALVQMAGRVGRKAAHPTGQVDFICAGVTRSLQQACRQIKKLNRKAGF